MDRTVKHLLFRAPTHRPIVITRIAFGVLLLGDALRTPQRPVLGQVLTVLLGAAMLASGGAEVLPRSWRIGAAVLRSAALIGWGSCVVVLLVMLARAS
jgi:hypothetical protein